MSKNDCIAYGAAATALGGLLTYFGATGGPGNWRRDEAVTRAIPTMAAELIKRYGFTGECTEAQIEATAREMKVSPSLTPYLLAAFMGRRDLAQLGKQFPGIDWRNVEASVERAYDHLPEGDVRRSHFHPSWVDTQDA